MVSCVGEMLPKDIRAGEFIYKTSTSPRERVLGKGAGSQGKKHGEQEWVYKRKGTCKEALENKSEQEHHAAKGTTQGEHWKVDIGLSILWILQTTYLLWLRIVIKNVEIGIISPHFFSFCCMRPNVLISPGAKAPGLLCSHSTWWGTTSLHWFGITETNLACIKCQRSLMTFNLHKSVSWYNLACW